MKYISFLPLLPFHRVFEYQTEEEIEIGDVIHCHFGKFQTLGFVLEVYGTQKTEYRLAKAGRVVMKSVLDDSKIKLLQWLARYYGQPNGMVGKMFFPFSGKENPLEVKMVCISVSAKESSLKSAKWKKVFHTLKHGNAVEFSVFSNIESYVKKGFLEVFYTKQKLENHQAKSIKTANLPPLSGEQNTVWNEILTTEDEFAVHLLHGKTGSGKTEVYVHLAQKIAQNGTILILLPEIGLAKVISGRIEKRFNCKIPVWHSGALESKKWRIFQEIKEGKHNIVVGTRSALFLPFSNLKMIIIDEEHDSSYKQEETPVYNARDTAVFYGKLLNIPVVLGSATPSVESFYNAQSGRYFKHELGSRFANVQMPEIKIVNEKSKFLLSPTVQKTILEYYKNGWQSLVFINRRGFSPINRCSNCKGVFKCDCCDVLLTYHKKKGVLACHHCNFEVPVHVPCVMCGEDFEVKPSGAGVEAVAQEIIELVTENSQISLEDIKAGIRVFSSDEQNTENKLSKFIDDIQAQKVKIIIGTQIASKGYDFSNLKLVCVVDLVLKNDEIDFKSNEKVMQLLTQVSGRSGRVGERGLVLIQSGRGEEHLNTLLSQNQSPFYNQEIEMRKENFLPPFSRFVSVTLSEKDEKFLEKEANLCANKLREQIKGTVLGAAPAPIAFIKNTYRFKILIIVEKSNIQIAEQIRNLLRFTKCKVKIDVDAISFF